MAQPRVAASWSELPNEILERCLSPLSPRELGKCRAVCKRWNTLIGETAATFEYELDRKDSRKKLFALVAPNDFKTNSPTSEYWCLMDLSTGIQHNLYCEFLDRLDGMERFCEQRTVAAAGSLICVLYTGSQGSRQSCVMVVCNPVAKTMRKLPPIDLHGIYGKINPGVVIVVDDNTYSYKIFVINDFDKKHPRLPRLYMYDSSVGQWQSRCNPPASCISSSSKILYDGLVYTLFSLGREMGHALAAYNIQEDKWDELRVRLPGNLKIPQLVVDLDRLYMVAGRDKSGHGKRRLEIHRITDTIFKTVAKTSDRKLVKLWDGYEFDSYTESLKRSPWNNVDDDIGTNAKFVALGHEKMILFMSSPEEVRYCDLKYQEYTWDKIGWCYPWSDPSRNLEIWRKLSHNSQREWFGSEMHLSLSFLL